MSGALASLLSDALRTLRHNVESVDGESRGPRELAASADRVAQGLAAAGVRPHEPVVVRIGNRPADLGALLGVWQAGAVAAPVHVMAAPTTLAALLKSTGARLIAEGDRLEVGGDAAPPDRPLLHGAALIVFTSGSTGQPKGAVLGHGPFNAKLAVLDRLLQLRPDDVVLLPLQLTFSFGMWVALLTLRSGARLMLVPKFSSDAIARGLVAGANVLAGVPSMYRTLLADPAYAMPRLRLLMTGGEVLGKPLGLALRRVAPDAALYDLFGLTETGTCDFVLGPAWQPEGFGSIGVPTEGVSFRIDAGELQVRTPFGMLGYLDNPELTAASFQDGYFKTGDLAARSRHGRIELIGRSKEIISRGGNKIAPLEIDNLLCEHPDVAAALCAGVPDERLGEVIHAVIVPRAGAQVTPDALRAWMLARTERFKVPDAFHLSDALPAGATGKADRRAVAALAQRLRSAQQ
jgi:acyl-CoA synthetase (AMP-forming)/AMP-acid ligase II